MLHDSHVMQAFSYKFVYLDYLFSSMYVALKSNWI